MPRDATKTPRIETSPQVQFGQPCLEGTRIPADLIAEVYMQLGLEEALTQWAFPEDTREYWRGAVLVCCWWAGIHLRRRKVGQWFREWAEENWSAMNRLDWSDVPWPPTQAGED